MSLTLRRKIASQRRIAALIARLAADRALAKRKRDARRDIVLARQALAAARASGIGADIDAAELDLEDKLAILRGIS